VEVEEDYLVTSGAAHTVVSMICADRRARVLLWNARLGVRRAQRRLLGREDQCSSEWTVIIA